MVSFNGKPQSCPVLSRKPICWRKQNCRIPPTLSREQRNNWKVASGPGQQLLEHPLGLDSNPGLAVLPGCAAHSAVNVAFELWSGWPCLWGRGACSLIWILFSAQQWCCTWPWALTNLGFAQTINTPHAPFSCYTYRIFDFCCSFFNIHSFLILFLLYLFIHFF